MKLVSWNVNGFRSCLTKGFGDFFDSVDADVFCIQETKMQPDQAEFSREGYTAFFLSAVKKGYSGTAIFTRIAPISVKYGIDGKYSDEGRLITLEFDSFYLVNSYTPNAQRELARIDYRMEFEDDLRAYLSELDRSKPVILCGDLNVAHNEIDLKNPKSNIGNAGFSYEERGKMDELLKALYDSFYESPKHEALKQEAADCHRQLIERLDNPERKLVLRIIDAKDHMAEELSVDSIIAGFQLAWQMANELNIREKERPMLAKKSAF
ncbi:MAG: exodeoxyribonuclease III, partial [Clostridia bacterium]|nr:exodeoxyribonuclease III [Clostridia bacterium]